MEKTLFIVFFIRKSLYICIFFMEKLEKKLRFFLPKYILASGKLGFVKQNLEKEYFIKVIYIFFFLRLTL